MKEKVGKKKEKEAGDKKEERKKMIKVKVRKRGKKI